MKGWILILAVAAAFTAQAASLTTNQPADTVLGQPDFTTYIPGTASASRMSDPYGVAIDPATGKIFVCDFGNNRVLRFASTVALTMGSSAEAVLGQPNFTTTASAKTATGMNGPLAAAVDGNGTLWVSDIFNRRLLRFANASSKATGAAADGVLGQTDFVSNGYAGATATSISQAYGLSVTNDGTLWVADSNASRVLRFDFASNKANGASADAVFGQPDFTSNTPPTTPAATSLDSPLGVAIDANGTLWIADYGNNRVLRYDHAALKPLTGAAADGVLGQPIFSTLDGSDTRYGLTGVTGVGIDAGGTLWVSCSTQHRVMGFANAAAKPNGALADLVLGQPSFVDVAGFVPATARAVGAPRQIACDSSGNVWVAEVGDHRVLRFHPAASPTPVPTALPKLALIGKNHVRTASATIRLKGTASAAAGLVRVEYRVGSKGSFHPAKGTAAWSFTAPLRRGVNAIAIRAVDQLGRTSASKILNVTRK